MKRSNINTAKSDKSYNMDLSEVYKVTFQRDFGAFKAGDETHVSLPIAMKWVKMGIVSETSEITSAAATAGCSDLLKKDKKKGE